MPQLMPLMWVLSTFMGLLMVFVMLDLYYYVLWSFEKNKFIDKFLLINYKW